MKASVTTVSVSLEENKRSQYPCNTPLSRHTKKHVPIAIPDAHNAKAATSPRLSAIPPAATTGINLSCISFFNASAT